MSFNPVHYALDGYVNNFCGELKLGVSQKKKLSVNHLVRQFSVQCGRFNYASVFQLLARGGWILLNDNSFLLSSPLAVLYSTAFFLVLGSRNRATYNINAIRLGRSRGIMSAKNTM